MAPGATVSRLEQTDDGQPRSRPVGPTGGRVTEARVDLRPVRRHVMVTNEQLPLEWPWPNAPPKEDGMRYIERVVWKPLDRYTESADTHAEGARAKPHGLVVDLGDGRMLMAGAPFKGSSVTIGVTLFFNDRAPTEKAEDVDEAILYAHRCACDHEYAAPGLVPPSSDMHDGVSAAARS